MARDAPWNVIMDGVALFAKPEDLGLLDGGGNKRRQRQGVCRAARNVRSGYYPAGSNLRFIMTGASPVLFGYGPA
jgi:hypothetical protein